MSVVASGERDVLLPREDGENLAVAQDDGCTLSERPALVQFSACDRSDCTPHQPALGGSASDRVCARVLGPAPIRLDAALPHPHVLQANFVAGGAACGDAV
jgi:hypothetical protein